jgi:hypothetical protein
MRVVAPRADVAGRTTRVVDRGVTARSFHEIRAPHRDVM